LRITEPFDGAVLNRRHGKQAAAALNIPEMGTAPPADRVTVNGIPCHQGGNRFSASRYR